MREIVTKVYKYDELSDKAKERACDWYLEVSSCGAWWEFIYEDAERVGVKITEFDLYRITIKIKFLSSAEETAHKIEKEHGETCETYKTAKHYLKSRDNLIDSAPKDENGDFIDEWTLDNHLDALDLEFQHDLAEDYLAILRQEYEYQTSPEHVEESIRINEYEFTEDGKIA